MMSNPVHKNSQKAFTLVEILVVIAVIGLLSSIIFAITRGADEQGRIARGLYFSQHLQNSLGSYAAGIWSFDEGSGSTANDISGWNNNGSLVNSPTWRCASTDTSYTPSGQGCSLEFNGSTQYVNAGSGASLAIASGGFTLEAWIYPKKIDCSTTVTCAIWSDNGTSDGGDVIAIRENGYLWYYTLQSSWNSLTSTIPVSLNSWSHVVFTWDGETKKIYINGQEKGSTDAINNMRGILPVWIGRKAGSHAGYFQGLIDDTRIYNRSLTSTQIQSRYYAGLKRLLSESQISQEEYQRQLTMNR
jgi:prepilin-type N-terminal cleavage/methylation domain-containing protein